MNVSIGEKEERMMITGLHTVADIFCVGCGSIVGWTYVRFRGSNLVYICFSIVDVSHFDGSLSLSLSLARRLPMKRTRSTRKENLYLRGQ